MSRCGPPPQVWRVPNNDTGIAELVQHLAAVSPTLVVLVATGGYEWLGTTMQHGARTPRTPGLS